MKIAIVVPGGVDRSGEYRVIPALIALIARLALHHEVHVFALWQEAEPGGWQLAGACIHNVGRQNTIVRAVRAIVAEHRSSRFSLIQSIWSGVPGFVAVAAGVILRLPRLIHVAGGELVALPDIGYGGRLRWNGRLRESIVLRGATIVTAASAPMIEMLARLGIVAQRIPLGVDLNAWALREPSPRSPSEPGRLIHVASLNRVKDQTTLLRALAELSAMQMEYRLDIVGEDTLQGEIQALSARLGLSERVRFHGFLPQHRLVQLMRDSHLMIVSSRHEAGPVALLEAAAAAVPTVGTAVGHVVEWAPNAAVAVPVGDSVALARAIAGLLVDEQLRLRMAREARLRAAREDADYTARCFQAIYADISTRGSARKQTTDANAGSR
ncbi:MAG TPA: glycosyltransferase family 4 protein [Steroidobacteraceae bacterium]|nr:glycosyltransferase family 4 protein [Steroidobacteraceae bacterium]